MCRLAAFPPHFPQKSAIKILLEMLGGNDDGVGSAYVKDGEFVVHKYPYSLTKALKKHKKLFTHMPYDGWTLVHLRAATNGGNQYKNTHPFIKGKYCVAHNGVWDDAELVKLGMAPYVKFEGDTDSEVAAQIISDSGMKDFLTQSWMAGVYLALDKDGGLHVGKNSGSIEESYTTLGYMYATDLKMYWKGKMLGTTYIRFNGNAMKKMQESEIRDTSVTVIPDTPCGVGRGWAPSKPYTPVTSKSYDYRADRWTEEDINAAEKDFERRLKEKYINDPDADDSDLWSTAQQEMKGKGKWDYEK